MSSSMPQWWHAIASALHTNWSAMWYMLSAFSVISYTENPVYVVFAALGSWIGAYLSVTLLLRSQPIPTHYPRREKR